MNETIHALETSANPKTSVYVSAASFGQPHREWTTEELWAAQIEGPATPTTGPGPPSRPPHAPQMKFYCQVAGREKKGKAFTLLDDGCSGQIVSRKFVTQYKLDTVQSTDPVQLRLANGKSVGVMDTMARVKTWIGDYCSEDWMWVTDLSGYDLFIGQPWLETMMW